jgi:Ni2+-binding GTPase involved in maturation of urease and hydrogenase
MSDEPAKRPFIVVVGGFLGAGKTTLILAAARLLERRGLRSAVILNDQGVELVDRHHAGAQGMVAREVTGGCFCCRFSDLMTEIDALRSFSPDVIFTEPVGSCTDISATVLGPLKSEFDQYRVAPFTVLVDPARAAALQKQEADPDLAFLFKRQLQEADVLCISKADLYPDAPAIPGVEVHHLSAVTGIGVAEWLDEILGGTLEAGKTLLEIDYKRYAEAEAALAWLNLSFAFAPNAPTAPLQVVGSFLDGLDHALTAAGIPIVHMKLFCNSAAGWLKAAICANGEEPKVEGHLDASPANRHEVLLNLRAKGAPEEVRQMVEEQFMRLEGRASDVRMDCFSPAPPRPERRVERSPAVSRVSQEVGFQSSADSFH